MMPTAFVATDPDTGRRIGVAWNELDASEMMTRADAILGRYMSARLEFVEVSRTPEQMREARAERAHQERHRAERARVAALYQPPSGYTIRRYPPLAPSTLRRRFDPGWALYDIAEADGWTTFRAMPYGQDTHPLATRGLILIADPPRPSMPRLYIATPKGREYVAANPARRTWR